MRALLAISLFALGACAHHPNGRPDTQRLDALVPTMLAEKQVPSVSVARLERGRLVWARAWGTRAPGVPASETTLYNIASLAKPVSAETVLRAASRGLLSLDEAMYPHWVDPDIASDPRHRELTPRLSLTHRTGFPNWRFESGNRLVFRYPPGAEPHYSGEGFEYLARFAERRTGVRFEDLARRFVFEPAGMTDTAYTRRDWFEGRVASPTDAEGRTLDPTIRESFLASDDLYTTARDYARFLSSVARRQGLSLEIARQSETVQVSTRPGPCPPARADACPDEAGWGLGWDLAVFGRERVLWHTGGDRGEFTFAYVIPATGEGMVILTNSAVGHRMVLPILEAVQASPRFLAFLRAEAGE